jgi:hypothetical protein
MLTMNNNIHTATYYNIYTCNVTIYINCNYLFIDEATREQQD